jgi:hypothetical protein
MDRLTAQLREWGQGNFGGAGRLIHPGLSRIWRKGLPYW